MYISDKLDVIGDSERVIAAAASLAEFKLANEHCQGKRICFVCYKDLSDIMGCYVFVHVGIHNELRHPRYLRIGKSVYEVLVCCEHGANGKNNFQGYQFCSLVRRIEQDSQ